MKMKEKTNPHKQNALLFTLKIASSIGVGIGDKFLYRR